MARSNIVQTRYPMTAFFALIACCLFYVCRSSERSDLLLERSPVASSKLFLVDDQQCAPTTSPTPHVTEFRWSGGGVSGPTEGEENVDLDTTIHVDFLREFESAIGVPAASFESFDTLNVTQHNFAAFVNFFTSNVAVNTNPDCADRFNASHQLLCHVWAAQQHIKNSSGSHDNNSTIDGNGASFLFKGTALHSMCSLFLACAEWKRGRYSVPLSKELLQSTFDKVATDTKLMSASRVLLRNLIHGGSNWREYDWLADRVETSLELLVSETSAVDVRSAMQGGEFTIRNVTNVNGTVTQRFSARRNGEIHHHLTRPLSALETIAVLHHRATSGKPQMVVFPRSESIVAPDDAFTECRVPAINVLLFSGDSIGRQKFIRLIDLVRHGPQGQVLVPYGTELLKTNFRHWPVQDRIRWWDIVLAIYPTHDELLLFTSLMPRSVLAEGKQFVRSNESVTSYFAAVANRRANKFCNTSTRKRSNRFKRDISHYDDNGSTSRSEQQDVDSLFYLVFLRDAVTSRPRTDALAPCVPSQPIGEFPPEDIHNFDTLTSAASRGLTLVHDPPVPSLRSLGIRIPMHVISANMWEVHESQTTYEWLMRMATGNCSVATSTAEAVLPPEGGEWRFGEHPTSDVTHLYRVSTLLWLPPHAIGRRRHSPIEFKEPSRRAPFSAVPPTGPRELARLATSFRWLRDAVRKVTGSDPMNQTMQNSSQRSVENRHRHGTFFSRLRVLDMGKVFLATGNVIRQYDGLHEHCSGLHWLVGAASFSDASRALRTSAENLTREVFKILPTSHFPSEIERIPFHFDDDDDCASLGTLLTLNALLLDIVQSESPRKRMHD